MKKVSISTFLLQHASRQIIKDDVNDFLSVFDTVFASWIGECVFKWLSRVKTIFNLFHGDFPAFKSGPRNEFTAWTGILLPTVR